MVAAVIKGRVVTDRSIEVGQLAQAVRIWTRLMVTPSCDDELAIGEDQYAIALRGQAHGGVVQVILRAPFDVESV